jgi:hypothetical protein
MYLRHPQLPQAGFCALTQVNDTSESNNADGELTVDPLLGMTISHRYQIESILGHGGWSTVYAARDLSIQRSVAFKVLHLHLARDTETVKRFRREAEAAGAINNAHVVTIYDSGITPTGQPYIVMELVNGQSLAQILESQQRLPVKQAVDIFIQACEGLHAAHKRGVIHRDLKPSNILLTKTEHQNDLVKVLDFGLAKFSPQENKEDLTATGVTFGTPAYMSPEQCQGHELDERSDIYSLGSVMYRTVTGQKAIDGDNIYVCMSKQVLETPKAFDQVRTDLYIPASLEQIIFKTLAKQPSERFQSMEELRRALQNFRSGLDTMSFLRGAKPVSAMAPKLLVGTAIVAGLATVVGVFVVGVNTPATKQAQNDAKIAGSRPPVPTVSLAPLPAPRPVPLTGAPTVPQMVPLTGAPTVPQMVPLTGAATVPLTVAPTVPRMVPAGESPLAAVKPLAPKPAPVAPVPKPVSTPQPAPTAVSTQVPSGEQLLRKKNAILHAEAMLNPILQMVGVPVEPIPTADFVADPDGYADLMLANKVHFFQRVAPMWMNQTGQTTALKQIVSQMQELEKRENSVSPVVMVEMRLKLMDQALSIMNVQAPAPDLRAVPPTFFMQAVDKRVRHKLARIELAGPDWIVRGGDHRQLENMLAQFKTAMDQAIRD